MRVINLQTERSMAVVQMILVAAKLIQIDLNEENLYKFAAAVEGKLNTSMSPWLLGKSPSQTRCHTTKPKVHGSYVEARVYKKGLLKRIKTGHKAQINWIY
jgi:hypothetical protein